MKRASATLLLSFLVLVFLGTPFLILAQDEGPAQCCKIRHNITIDTETVNANTIIGDFEEADYTTHCSIPRGTPPTPFKRESNWGAFCSIDAIQTVADIVTWVAFVLVGCVFVVAGALFITAGGSPERINSAKKIFFWGLVGAMVVLFAQGLLSLVRFFLGI